MARKDRETGVMVRDLLTLSKGYQMRCQVCGNLWGGVAAYKKEHGRFPPHYRECLYGCTRDQIGKKVSIKKAELTEADIKKAKAAIKKAKLKKPSRKKEK